MSPLLGVIAALIAMLSWGFGDFAIQRSVRKVGTPETIFFIGILGMIVLTPIVWDRIPNVTASPRAIEHLFAALLATLFVAIVELEAFERAKLSVVESMMSFELIFTLGIGLLVLNEKILPIQFLLAILVFCGVILTVLRNHPRHWWSFTRKRNLLEKGVLLAVLSAVLMSVTNIYTGLASQLTDPLLTVWFIDTCLAITMFLWIMSHGRLFRLFHHLASFWQIILAASILDNMAWISYATAVKGLPISVTVGITESYVALAAFLGIVWNHEKLQTHQTVGMLAAIGAAITLAVISG